MTAPPKTRTPVPPLMWHPAASLGPILSTRDVTSYTELGDCTDPHSGAGETLVSPLTPFTSTLVIMQPFLTLLSIPFILASVPVRPSRQG